MRLREHYPWPEKFYCKNPPSDTVPDSADDGCRHWTELFQRVEAQALYEIQLLCSATEEIKDSDPGVDI